MIPGQKRMDFSFRLKYIRCFASLLDKWGIFLLMRKNSEEIPVFNRKKKCWSILALTPCLLSLGNNGKLDSDDEDILTTAAAFVVREGY